MTQTDDGYLWVGTLAGLYRFDGASFELMSSLGGQSISRLPVITLFSAPGGAVWVGFGGGAGGGHYKDGVYTAIGPDKGWGNMVSGTVDRDGVAWVVVDRRLVRVENSVRTELTSVWGLPQGAIREVVVDKAGTVWVSTSGRDDLLYLPRGEQSFLSAGQHIGLPLLAAAPDGTIFASGVNGLSAVVTKNGRPLKIVSISKRQFGRVLADRDGGLIASTTSGLLHIGDAKRLIEPEGEQRLFNDALLLSRESAQVSPVVWSLTEDRDGNVWVAASDRLERFRDSRFTPVPLKGTAFSYGVVPGENGSVWASNWDSGVLRLDAHNKVNRVGNVGPHLSILHRDASGMIWAAGPTGVWRSNQQGQFNSVVVPEALLQPWVFSMIVDASGEPWLYAAELIKRDSGGGAWRELSEAEGYGNRHSTRTMLSTASGRVWLASGTDIVCVDGTVPRAMAELSKKVDVGPILSMLERGPNLWFGGLGGVAVVHSGRVMNLKAHENPPFNQVIAVIETAEGDLWIRGAEDAWHVSADALSRALRDDQPVVEAEHFDSLDGIASVTIKGKSTAAQATDGLIWFGTRQGLTWVDPARPKVTAPTPLRHIQSVSVDGRKESVKDSVTLPAQSRHLEIAYTALELGYPERIQFRYKLDGFDREWQAAGTRRVAYYNELPPGDYRFRFSSTDREGHWQAEEATSLSIRAMPAWFQTAWFKLGCALLAFTVAALLYRLRIRQMALRLRKDLTRESFERARVATARQDERDRIARALHDTLIQSTQGLILIFQGLAEKIAPDSGIRNRLYKALVRANEVAAEGRDMIEDLRLPVLAPVDLPGAFCLIGSEVGEDHAALFRVVVTGSAKEVQPGVGDAICRIGREAIINAFRHAGATAIEVEILHDDAGLSVSIRDDGVGIPQATLAAANIPGHWGIQGMRERAERMGASLDFHHRADGGTEVRLTVPSATIYQKEATRSWWDRFQRSRAAFRELESHPPPSDR